jgi:CRISPR-associated endonuclease/helicase Cas3
MRTLVEQTEREVKGWLEKLSLIEGSDTVHGPIVLMGGEDPEPWDIFPERNIIIIGTQDMLLSRALNRGYGMARARWPMHFGLLNNDCLWVLDETQLMGVGVCTSAQLEGLRHRIGTGVKCASWWASATLDTRLLKTPDLQYLPASTKLDEDDLKSPQVQARVQSVKSLRPCKVTLAADTAKAVSDYAKLLAETICESHQRDTLTLVILNRVDRAREVYSELLQIRKTIGSPDCLLIHSRFRPTERKSLADRLRSPGEKIVISTQAIEAGVDISAKTLITELAPWSSLVQRFGRCNRNGELNQTGGGEIQWIDLAPEKPDGAAGLSLPYSEEQLDTARKLIRSAERSGASPVALRELVPNEPLPEHQILRQKDLVELFETTPDLSGLDLDIGRYIRDDEDRDVQVFWRNVEAENRLPDEGIEPRRNELVRVGVGAFRKFLEDVVKKTNGRVWRRDPVEGEWVDYRATRRIIPGAVFLLSLECGGYSDELGWTGDIKDREITIPPDVETLTRSTPADGQNIDEESAWPGKYESLSSHTAKVVEATNSLLQRIDIDMPSKLKATLETAARWHDVGKAHPCFQAFLKNGASLPEEFRTELLAKAPRTGRRFYGDRRIFRHELASALAWLQTSEGKDELERSLVAFLIATHHGKVRLSLRAMPGETSPPAAAGADPLFARGIWHGDRIPAPEGPALQIEGIPNSIPPLDLTLIQLGESNGRPSWTARMLSLRDHPQFGIFRLALLETLLRSADARASTN